MKRLAWTLLVFSAACGTSDTNTLSDTDAGIREPLRHRAAPVACDHERPSRPIDFIGPDAECTSHEACTDGENGRCLASRFGLVCTYDACFGDADCGAHVCECEGGFGGDHNVCLSEGNCRVDADCGPGNFCSPSRSSCGDYSGTVGYYCHTSQDECIDDEDCGSFPWYCRYDRAVTRWICSDSHCAG